MRAIRRQMINARVFGIAAMIIACSHGCDRGGVSTTTGPTPAQAPAATTIAYDFSKSRHIDSFAWPRHVTDDIWFLEGRYDVTLTGFDGTTGGPYLVDKIHVIRAANQVGAVRLLFLPETFEQAYERAKILAVAWRVPVSEEFEQWHQRKGRSGGGGRHPEPQNISRNDGKDVVIIDVRSNHDRERAWYIMLSYGMSETSSVDSQKTLIHP